ncbi:phage tail tube protein [Caproicibacterium sp. XB1]|uniref:phage tail tube protein n=1 Tax=Caproicibacterium sp. XB1 TaxID=3396405 RepID=UPI0039B6FCD7
MGTFFNPTDALAASQAECYATISGKRYTLFSAISLSAKYEKTKKEVPILGRVTKGNKAVGGKGTGTLKMHYVTSMFRKLMMDYINTGKDFYFDIQATNEDETSGVGRQTVVLKNCNLDSVILTQFDASSEDLLSEELPFTFESVQMPESFKDPVGIV